MLIQVAVARGQGSDVWGPLLRRCRELDPGFDVADRIVAPSLRPAPREPWAALARFASEAADETSESLGEGRYARIAAEVLVVRHNRSLRVPRETFDWDRIERGFDDLEDRFPRSSHNTNLYAWLALSYGDDEKLSELLHSLGEQWCSDAEDIWGDREMYLGLRARRLGSISALPAVGDGATDSGAVRITAMGTLEEARAALEAEAFADGPNLPERKAACDRGDLQICGDLGVRYGKGDGVAPDRQLANRYFQRACDGGLASACFNLAVTTRHGVGAPKDEARATELFEAACAGGAGAACFAAGRAYEEGSAVEEDGARAQLLFEEACRHGDAEACYRLALAEIRSVGGLKEAPRALEWLSQACGGGVFQACLRDGDVAPPEPYGRYDETARIDAIVFGLLEAGLFADLEERFAQVRREGHRISNGLPALYYYYRALYPDTRGRREPATSPILDRWAGTGSDSFVLKMGLLRREMIRAREARRSPHPRSPSERPASVEHLEEAWRIASEAERQSAADPELYGRLLNLCAELGKPWAETQTYLERGLAADPEYEVLFLDVVRYLLPRWHGSPEAVHQLALRAVDRTQAQLGLGIYARIAMTVALVEGAQLREEYPFDWARLEEAFGELRHRHPDSDELLRAYAWFVWLYRDADAAPRALAGLRRFEELEERREARQASFRDECYDGDSTQGLNAGAVVLRWECRRHSIEGHPWDGVRPWTDRKGMARAKAWLEQAEQGSASGLDS